MKDPARGPFRRWIGALAEFALALAVALVLGEVCARLFLRLPPRVAPVSLNLKQPVAEALAPGMGECLVQGGEAVVHYPNRDGTSREVRYRTNSDGFRDRTYERQPPEGTLRIAVLGDSIAFGFGVAEEDAPPKQLERELGARLGSPVEVLNCGVYSFNATQQAAHLRYRVAAFEPDLVLFLTTVTDASGGAIADAPGKNDTWQVRWIARLGLMSGRFALDDPALDPAQRRQILSVLDPAQRRMLALRQRSALVDYLANGTHTWLYGQVMTRNYQGDWQPGSPGRATVTAAYADARDFGAERGFEVRVALYPVLDRLDDYALGPVHASVAEICAELGLGFHDLLPALAGEDATALHAHAHDKHPNARANQLVAEYLAAELEPIVARGLGQ
jgi:lysophospholipase L1-like esterase